MGGRYDATNVLKHKAVNVISRVGLDHQEHLGPTLADIAFQKCGIFAPNVPIIFSSSNPADVLRTIRHQAQMTRSRSLRSDFNYDKRSPPAFPNFVFKRDAAPDPSLLQFRGPHHQRDNKCLAFFAAHALLCALGRAPGRDADSAMERAIDATRVPGRLQRVSLAGAWTRRPVPALVDGAHNADAARAVSRAMRSWSLGIAGGGGTGSATFVVAVSGAGKVRDVVAPLLRDGDAVFAVEFGLVAGMDREPYPAEAIRAELEQHAAAEGMHLRVFAGNLRDAMSFAEERYEQVRGTPSSSPAACIS